ncbi:MAG: phosphatidylserine decarboxylase [Acidobacteriota bacterium]
MTMDRAGWPFVAPAFIAAVVAAALGWPVMAVACGGAAGFFVFFFRDPARTVPAGDRVVVSPADGRVLVAGDADPASAPAGRWMQISIFLSPLDVHINRIPSGGRVTRIVYTPGRFLPAYRAGAASANERNEIWIDREGRQVVCRQVVGILARRLVCRTREGAMVSTGERYGLMKFGSRFDLFLPPEVVLKVRVGDRVRGGETVVATW